MAVVSVETVGSMVSDTVVSVVVGSEEAVVVVVGASVELLEAVVAVVVGAVVGQAAGAPSQPKFE